MPLVVLIKIELPEDIGANGEMMFRSPQASDVSIESIGGNGELSSEYTDIVCWMTIPAFERRLEELRDLYEEIVERDEPWDQNVDANPWGTGDEKAESMSLLSSSERNQQMSIES